MVSGSDSKKAGRYRETLKEDLFTKYGDIFERSYNHLKKMRNLYSVDDTIVHSEMRKLSTQGLFGSFMEKLKSIVSSQYSKDATSGEKSKALFSNLVLDITAVVDVSADIGEIYKVDNSKKSLMELNIMLADKLLDDPNYCRKAIKLLNKVAINSFAIKEIMEHNSVDFEDKELIGTLTVELFESLIYAHDSMPSNRYRNLVNKSFSMVEGRKKGYNIALLRREEISSGIADDKIAINRLVGLHYLIKNIIRE
jgi:hypothetical protein